jgi:hypothetical protein
VANRHALLIGVPCYGSDEFNDPRLTAAVQSDVVAMREALERSDYKITECGTPDSGPGAAGLNRINHAIEEACSTAPVGGVLIIYPYQATFLRDRLRLYAPLFKLDLPEEATRAETAVG